MKATIGFILLVVLASLDPVDGAPIWPYIVAWAVLLPVALVLIKRGVDDVV